MQFSNERLQICCCGGRSCRLPGAFPELGGVAPPTPVWNFRSLFPAPTAATTAPPSIPAHAAAPVVDDATAARRSHLGVPVANPVMEDRSLAVASLPRAEQHDISESEAQMAMQRKRRSRRARLVVVTVGAAAVVAAICVIAAVAVLGAQRNSKQGSNQTNALDAAEEAEATTMSLEQHIWNLLPDCTRDEIESDRNSPQAAALEWLMQDPCLSNVNCSDARLVQRFALVTFCFATGGDDWLHNEHWLNCNVHECQWFTHDKFDSFGDTRFVYYNASDVEACHVHHALLVASKKKMAFAKRRCPADFLQTSNDVHFCKTHIC